MRKKAFLIWGIIVGVIGIGCLFTEWWVGLILLIGAGVLIFLYFKVKVAPKPAPARSTVEKEFMFNVAGVSFSNGTKSRQTILRAMKDGSAPFDEVTITLQRYDYEGSLAIAVYANGEQIGNVPKDLKDDIDSTWTSGYTVESWEVLGTGKERPMGCRIKILFQK